MQRESQELSRPEIRVVHIFAPEIIKTDPANFRELVQKLTGKPTKKKKKKKTTTEMIKNEVEKGKEEREVFAICLGDEDGFLNGLSTDVPFLPLLNASHMDLIEEEKSFKS